MSAAPATHGNAAAFPWQSIMAAGLGTLRLAPAQFWAMTPKELSAAVAGLYGRRADSALQRRDLQNLMMTYPDEEKYG